MSRWSNRGLREGLFWHVIMYAFLHSCIRIYRGEFGTAQTCIRTILAVYDNYEYHIARSFYLSAQSESALMSRKLRDANNWVDEDLSVARKLETDPHLMMGLGRKIATQFLSGDTSGARDTLSQEQETRKYQVFWIHHYVYRPLLARLMFSVGSLEEAVKIPEQINDLRMPKNCCSRRCKGCKE